MSHVDCVIFLDFKLTTLLEIWKLFSATSYYLKAISGFCNFHELASLFWKKRKKNILILIKFLFDLFRWHKPMKISSSRMVHQIAIRISRVSFHLNFYQFNNEMHVDVHCYVLPVAAATAAAHLFALSSRETLSRNCEEALDEAWRNASIRASVHFLSWLTRKPRRIVRFSHHLLKCRCRHGSWRWKRGTENRKSRFAERKRDGAFLSVRSRMYCECITGGAPLANRDATQETDKRAERINDGAGSRLSRNFAYHPLLHINLLVTVCILTWFRFISPFLEGTIICK